MINDKKLKALNYWWMSVPTTAYSSNFSAGVDGWTNINVTLAGNIDSISDGSTSYSDVLRGYATATAAAHDFVKAGAVVGRQNRVKFRYYIPSDQTNTNDLRLLGNLTATTIALEANFSQGQWNYFTSNFYTATHTNIYIRMSKNSNVSFAGANLVTDDLIYLRDVTIEYI